MLSTDAVFSAILLTIGDSSMKRQKRDPLGRAHSKGYQAGLSGKNKEQCPYQNVDVKSQWLGGWRDAISDRSSGLFK